MLIHNLSFFPNHSYAGESFSFAERYNLRITSYNPFFREPNSRFVYYIKLSCVPDESGHSQLFSINMNKKGSLKLSYFKKMIKQSSTTPSPS